VGRTELRLLHHRFNVRVLPTKVTNLPASVADYNSHCGRSHSLGGPNHMVEQGKSTHPVEDFGQLGLHPGALPGGQNHDVCQSLSRLSACTNHGCM